LTKKQSKKVPPSGAARLEALEHIRAIVAFLSESARAVEQRTGVTNAQLFLLQALAERDGQSIGELAAFGLTGQSTVSIVVGRLEEAGLVARAESEADRRRTLVQLTPAGRRLLKRAPVPPTRRLHGALEKLSPAQRHQLARSLRALRDALGLDPAEAPPLFEKRARG
jgi:DNA-binding MarR family transcriptional regulator